MAICLCPQCGQEVFEHVDHQWKFACGKCLSVFVVVDITHWQNRAIYDPPFEEKDCLDLLCEALDYVDSPEGEMEVSE
jgi:hypothetical protein